MVQNEPVKKRIPGVPRSLPVKAEKDTDVKISLMKIYCKKTQKRYLLDTGASVSLIPKEPNDKADPDYFLKAANGSMIQTYGKQTIELDLGLGLPMKHKFIKGDVTEGILGADFMVKHGIILDMKRRTVTQESTGIRKTLNASGSTEIYNITEPHCEEAEELLAKYPGLIPKPGEPLGTPPDVGIEHEIDIVGRPPAMRARRLNPRMLEAAKEHFEEMLKNGVVEESSAPYASPLHVVEKKDNQFRWVGDYRALNAVTKPNKYSLPFIADAMNSLNGKEYFSVIDLKSAFNLVYVKKEHRDYTSIITPFGSFRYIRLPFGLCGASSTFQRYIDYVLRGISTTDPDGTKRKIHIFAYIDDILVASRTKEEHKRDLEAVLAKLDEFQMKISAHKCKFFQKEVDFLGFRLNKVGVSPTEEKIKTIREYPMPKTLGEVKSFVGLIHFFHKHIKNAAEVMGPLHDLLRGYKKLKKAIKIDQNDPSLIKSFNDTKAALINSTTLAYPSVTAEIALCTDASDSHIGAVLQQRENDQEGWQPLGFFSKKCSPRERGQSIFYRELLAIYKSLKYFQFMITGNKFTIYTDHAAICAALKSNKPRDNAQEVRMLGYVGSWQRPVLHVKGTDNFVADLFSRTEIESPECNIISIATVTREELIAEQAKTSEIQEIIKDRNMGLKLRKFNGVYCNQYKDVIRPYVPETLRKRIFDSIHNLGHAGIERTLKMIRNRYVWFSMRKDIRNWVKSCRHCQVNKIHKHNKPPIDCINVPSEKFRHIVVDIVGPLIPSEGYKYLLTMICRYSGWLEAVPLKEANTGSVLEALFDTWFARFGYPFTLQTDRGSVFSSQKFRDMMQTFGVQQKFSCSYTPSSQGIIERTHRVLKSSLRGENAHTWKKRLGFTLLSIRSSFCEGIQCAPSAAVYGTSLRLPGAIIDGDVGKYVPPYTHAETVRKEMAKVNFRERKFPSQPGKIDSNLMKCDYVYVRKYDKKHSLESQYEGPFKIIKRYDKYYLVQLDRRIDCIALHRLKSAINPVPDHADDINQKEEEYSDSEDENHRYNATNPQPNTIRSLPVRANNSRPNPTRGTQQANPPARTRMPTSQPIKMSRYGRIIKMPNRFKSSR